MSIRDLMGIADDAIGLADKFILDKDQAKEIKTKVLLLKEQAYITELQTKTVPWIDAIHKMGRQILSILSLILPAILLYAEPSIDPLAIAAL